ncbi:hypothetical protein [Shewanella frigidimarina]|uniref:DUF4178 domain-containing protein n=1 Tax=Shewanella frigidimarina (strain NCIMB 400) TaxID=318167 RepID=Q07Y11_SHEFN|nr:hypothetical protein [Shewanella frigidimarina]ABI73103.1 conserved hypothetical protein [Shewanella frigidimarina NCIMB 400]RPA33740.1 hypothetical protein EGC78_07715 [Shewanella frigidimarina]|tara:strand:+ start:24 stop:677 length:654 start_codon:yes stop_codon:yes gene_type:complete
MGFLSGLFGKKEAPKRQLDHPNKLLKGDMITFDDSFALPTQLRGQQLKVEAIHTYEYQRSQLCEFLLRGHSGTAIYLSYVQEDESYLSISMKINRAVVEQLFDLDAFAEIFEEPGKATLTLQALPAELAAEFDKWLSDEYHQVEFAAFGYFHRQDYRDLKPPQNDDDARGEGFEGYSLANSDDTHALDVEVYESGDTEVMLTLYRPLTDIREYWPAS